MSTPMTRLAQVANHLRPSPETHPNSTITADPAPPLSKPDSSDPKPFVMATKQGTNPEAFRIFTESLPDQGSGDFWTADSILIQTYQTYLTWDEMVEVQKEQFIDYVVLITPTSIEGWW